MATQQKKNDTQKKKQTKVTVKNTNRSKEIAALILAAVGVFLFFALIGKAGLFGSILESVLYGLFGKLATIVMLCLMFAIAWCLLRGTADKVFSVKKSLLFAGLLLVVSALVHTCMYSAADYAGLNFIETVSLLWAQNDGGVIGGGLSLLLQKAVARSGALVILIPALIIIAMVLFSLSIVRFAKWIAGKGKGVSAWASGVRARFRAEKRAKALARKKQARQEEQEEQEAQRKQSNVYDEEDEDDPYDDEDDDEIDYSSSSDKYRGEPVPEVDEDDEDDPYDDEEPGVYAHDEDVPEIDDVPTLPDTGDVIPTKIPDPRQALSLVTASGNTEYVKPQFSLLHQVSVSNDRHEEQRKLATKTARQLEEVMRSFGIEAKVNHVSRGSTVTMYELQPQSGVKVARIKNLADDIALNLAASGIRIVAPIPGKAAIGIEIPNDEKSTVYLKSLIETNEFLNHKSKLAFCLGEDISGAPVIADIAKMPHVLIAGTTGSGKSVCVNCLIVSLLYRCSPDDVRLIMIDPKVVELQIYNGIPHLLIPVVTEPKKAAAALSWAVQEMENRYKQFAMCNIRDINAYNVYAKENNLPTLPRIVIIIDELADLMMVVRDSIEEAINRIAQKARAAGMHLIVATQRPSVDVITGLIKANIPSRIAFAVSSQVDSKTILDYAGAEKLLGRGDMLYSPVGSMKATRVQGGFVSDGEIEDIVEFIKDSCGETEYDDTVSSQIDNVKIIEKGGKRGGGMASSGGGASSDGDPLLSDALDIAIETKQISASFLQRKLGLGFSRASRLIDQMEERGYISCRDGNNPRHVLVQENPMRNE